MARIIHKRGDTFKYTVVLNDAAGDPIDITGYVIAAQARATADAAATLFDVGTVGGGISITDAAAGKAVLTVAETATDDWSAGDYVLDIQYDDGSVVFSTESITLTVLPDVTK